MVVDATEAAGVVVAAGAVVVVEGAAVVVGVPVVVTSAVAVGTVVAGGLTDVVATTVVAGIPVVAGAAVKGVAWFDAPPQAPTNPSTTTTNADHFTRRILESFSLNPKSRVQPVPLVRVLYQGALATLAREFRSGKPPGWRSNRAFLQAAYRPRDIAKQRELVRTVDQSNRQARGCFRVFAQVSGLGCIDLGDRRSEVQILSAQQKQPRLLDGLRPRLTWR